MRGLNKKYIIKLTTITIIIATIKGFDNDLLRLSNFPEKLKYLSIYKYIYTFINLYFNIYKLFTPKMKIIDLLNTIATFFVNETTANIMPEIKGFDETCIEYRQQLDTYCTLITVAPRQQNKAYEKLKDKLMNFIIKFKGGSENEIILLVCKNVCPPDMLLRCDITQYKQMFRRFITECVEKLTTYMLSECNSFLSLIITPNRSLDKIQKYRSNLITLFEDIVNKIMKSLYIQFACTDRSIDPNIYSQSDENKIIEQLKKQNEDLQFTILKLKEDIGIFKQRIAFFEMRGVPEEQEPEEQSEESEE